MRYMPSPSAPLRVVAAGVVALAFAGPALASPCASGIELFPAGALSEAVFKELEAMDDGGLEGACAVRSATLAEGPEGVDVTLTLEHGEVDYRRVPDAVAAATWIDAMGRTERLAELLNPDAGDASVLLYSSFERWRDGQPDMEVDAEVLQSERIAAIPAAENFGPYFALDLVDLRARETVKSFALVHDGVTYINDGAPWPGVLSEYGRLERVGDMGVYAQRFCAWIPATPTVPAHLQCFEELKVIDLADGSFETISRRRLRQRLEAHPELAAAYAEERRLGPETTLHYLLLMLAAEQE